MPTQAPQSAVPQAQASAQNEIAQPIDEAQVVDIVRRAVDDGRLLLLRTDAQNDPITEDIHMVKHVFLQREQRLYFDNVL